MSGTTRLAPSLRRYPRNLASKSLSIKVIYSTEDPTIPFGQWQLGNSCPVPSMPIPGFNMPVFNYTCDTKCFPAFVVNASTTKHVQLAVNFARNNNIRLAIK